MPPRRIGAGKRGQARALPSFRGQMTARTEGKSRTRTEGKATARHRWEWANRRRGKMKMTKHTARRIKRELLWASVTIVVSLILWRATMWAIWVINHAAR